MNQPLYEHTQFGWVIVVALGGGLALVLAVMALGFDWIGLVIAVLLVSALWLFASLTVTLDAERLTLRFGPGLVQKSFAVREIEAARAVTNSLWYGWGIHWTPAGWVYNVSGFGAVEVRLRDGRIYRIGSDEPQALALAIERAVAGRH